jgi:uncharacterized RDD family membrane protein YckC
MLELEKHKQNNKKVIEMDNDGMIYAGIFRRMLAFGLDLIILLVLNIAIFVLLQKIGIKSSPEQENPLVSIILLIVNWLYFGLFETSNWLGTPGKKLTSIAIVNEAGEKISLIQSTQRFVLSFLTLFTLFIGFFVAWRDAKKQAIHDRFSKSWVVLFNK